MRFGMSYTLHCCSQSLRFTLFSPYHDELQEVSALVLHFRHYNIFDLACCLMMSLLRSDSLGVIQYPCFGDFLVAGAIYITFKGTIHYYEEVFQFDLDSRVVGSGVSMSA